MERQTSIEVWGGPIMSALIATLRTAASRKGRGILLCAALLIALAPAWPRHPVAQSAAAADGEVRVGDRWVYDTRDEMTGYPRKPIRRS